MTTNATITTTTNLAALENARRTVVTMLTPDGAADALKYGARNSRQDAKRIQDAHDTMVGLGAECAGGKVSTYRSPQPIKVLEQTADEIKIGGYGVCWGGKDIVGDYFLPTTDFYFDRLTPNPMVLYEHGQDATIKATVLGKVVSIKSDDIGLFIEAALDRHAKYMDYIMPLIEKGVLGWSSGSVGHLVKRAPDGLLSAWPVAEWSITVQPAEPRTLGVATTKAEPDLSGGAEPDPMVSALSLVSAADDLTKRATAFLDHTKGVLERRATEGREASTANRDAIAQCVAGLKTVTAGLASLLPTEATVKAADDVERQRARSLELLQLYASAG